MKKRILFISLALVLVLAGLLPGAALARRVEHEDAGPERRETRRGDRSFILTRTEFDLLQYLMRHPRQVLTRDRLLQDVWGYDFDGNANILEVYIGYLRTKTEAGGEPRLLQTVRGVGYVLRDDP